MEFEENKDGAANGFNVRNQNLFLKKKITKFRTLWRLIFCYLKYGKPKVVQIWNFRKLKLTRIKYLGIMAQV